MPCKSETSCTIGGLNFPINKVNLAECGQLFFGSKEKTRDCPRFFASARLIRAFSLFAFTLCLGFCAPRLPQVLAENSGLARVAADSLLWINDSGNLPTLYSTDGRGRLRGEVFFENEKNTDWEELARDPRDGRIFIGDFGNNGNARRDLHVLIFSPKTGATERLDFAWPDQSEFPPTRFDDQNFDCEAMVFWRDSLHFFTKSHWQGRSFLCKHFAVAARPGRQGPVFLEKTVLKNRVVSGAALSENGQTLALVGYCFGRRWGFLPFSKATIFTFEKGGDGLFFSKKLARQRTPGWPLSRQYEALAFAAEREILLSNEQLKWQKPRVRKIRLR